MKWHWSRVNNYWSWMLVMWYSVCFYIYLKFAIKILKFNRWVLTLCYLQAIVLCDMGNTHFTSARGLVSLFSAVSPVPRTLSAHSRSSLCPELQPVLWLPEDCSRFGSQELHPWWWAIERATDQVLWSWRQVKSHPLRGQDGASTEFLGTDMGVPEIKNILCIQNISKQSKIPPLI